MKKYIFIFLFGLLFLSGCGKTDTDVLDINSINDLSLLQDTIEQISQNIADKSITLEEGQTFITQLEEKYLELTDSTQQTIESQFDQVQRTLNQQSIFSYTLPLWAKKMGMIEPKGMQLNKILSKQYTNEESYSSTILVYKGNYTIALQQAKVIAEHANLHPSKMFEQGQAIAKNKDVQYISGLDFDNLEKGMIYVNYDLLETNVNNLLSVSVDQDGTLIIEATKYN